MMGRIPKPQPITIRGSIGLIPLPGGWTAVIDEEDIAAISKYRWSATDGGGQYPYVTRSASRKGIRKHIKLHRVLINAPAGLEVDHINGNSLDNRKVNLRICSHAQNLMNIHNKSMRGVSGYKGVARVTRSAKWRAYIKPNNKQKHLGIFSTPEAAARAYNVAAREYFGEYAQLNKLKNVK